MLENTYEWLGVFHEKLLAWYKIHKRSFPWRDTGDPYKILVAEKLLQQTRATEKVINSYYRIVEIYPTPVNLAKASIHDIEEVIQPLGFKYRAVHLHSMARELVINFNGSIPGNYSELMKLTGIGEYCSRAVLSFAFNQNIAVVDTNVGRFIFRLFNIKEPYPANPSRNKFIIEKAQSILKEGYSKEYNLAILDLCALICRHKKPICLKCPIQDHCLYDGKRLISE